MLKKSLHSFFFLMKVGILYFKQYYGVFISQINYIKFLNMSSLKQIIDNWKYHKTKVASYWLIKLDSVKQRKVSNEYPQTGFCSFGLCINLGSLNHIHNQTVHMLICFLVSFTNICYTMFQVLFQVLRINKWIKKILLSHRVVFQLRCLIINQYITECMVVLSTVEENKSGLKIEGR